MKNIKLNVIYDNMIVSIPFKNIKMLDCFTMRFLNPLEICACINRLYDLEIDKTQFMGVTISYDKDKNGNIAYVELPVKLYSDNYDLESVRTMYTQFFKDDRKRIKEWKYGIRNVKKHKALDDYVFGRNDKISDTEIENAVYAYFEGSSYLKYRNAYFNLIENGYNVLINEDDFLDIKPIRKTDLGLYNIEDTYFQSLINMSKLGEEEADKVIELLSLHDLDEIKRNIVSSEHSLFDGNLSQFDRDKYVDSIYKDDLLALEYFSGRKIDELIEMTLYIKNGYTR